MAEIRTVDLPDLRRMLSSGEPPQLVEVLPREEYDWAHLPGARHLPLKQLDDQAIADSGLERDRLVVAYCNDFL